MEKFSKYQYNERFYLFFIHHRCHLSQLRASFRIYYTAFNSAATGVYRYFTVDLSKMKANTKCTLFALERDYRTKERERENACAGVVKRSAVGSKPILSK